MISILFILNNVVPDHDWFTPDTLIRGDELVLIDMLMNIVSDEDVDEELEELLCIFNHMEKNVDIAMSYTKRLR